MTRKIAIALAIICAMQALAIHHMAPSFLAARQAAAVHAIN